MNNRNPVMRIFDWIYLTIQFVVNGFTQMIVNIFNDVVTNLAMVVVPVLPAYSVYNVLIEHHPLWASVTGAFAVEFAGIFISKTFFDVMSWQRVKNKSDENVNFNIVLWAGGIFYTLIFVNTLAIEIFPSAHVILIPSFVLLAPCTYAAGFSFFQVRVLRKEFDERQAGLVIKTQLGKEITQRKKDLADLRTEIDQEINSRTQTVNNAVRKANDELETIRIEIDQAELQLSGLNTNVQIKTNHEQKIADLKPNVKLVYNMTISTDLPAKEIAKEVGLTERTVQTYWKNLKTQGLIDEDRKAINPLTLNGHTT